MPSTVFPTAECYYMKNMVQEDDRFHCEKQTEERNFSKVWKVQINLR